MSTKKSITIRIPKEIWEQLEKVAESKEISPNKLAVMVIRERLDAQEEIDEEQKPKP